MRGFLVVLALLAVTFSTRQVAGMERTTPTWHAQSISAGQVRPSERLVSSRKVDPRRQFSVTSDFRAEELIPDICKGCSS